MTVFQVLQHALNVGVIDEDKLHRVDLERMRLGAEEQTNFMCDAVGRMFLRPGTDYIATAPGKPVLRPFVAAESAAYMLEFSDFALRIYFEDALLARTAVSSSVVSGTFASATGWTLAATAGQTTAINTSAGTLTLSARAHGGKALAKQQVATSSPGVVHALRVVVQHGPVNFRVGSSDGADDYIGATVLETGTHSLALLPTGSYWVQFDSTLPRNVIVKSVQVEGAGIVSLPTIWPTADLPLIRLAQSLDVMYVAADGYRPQRIERRGAGSTAGLSWSVVDYRADDGPFLAIPSSTAKLTPGALEGNTTLTSDVPFFKAGHVGALFRLYHDGQKVDTYIAGESQFTPAIQVTGINETNINERYFNYQIAGTWVGTIRNQRSFDGDDVDFHDYRDKQTSTNIDITTNVGPQNNDDDEDNAIAFYRIGFPPGLYTSGEAHVTITYNGGGGFGICRVTGYNSPTSVNVEVLSPFAGNTSTTNWLEGSWSSVQGYPTAVGFDDGRLVLPGSDKYWASVSDAYSSFDIDFEGDAGPIDRSIALGGRNVTRWMLSLSVAILGTDARIARAGGSALEEAVTGTNLTIRNVGNIGAAAVEPAELRDNSALFVEASGKAVYAIDFIPQRQNYVVSEFSKLSNELFAPGVTELVVQDRPDQRVHACTQDGDAITIIHEPEQQVTAFIPISTSSDTDTVVSRCIMPSNGELQDREYRAVERVVNGQTVYLVEKVALDIEVKPNAVCKVMDAGVTFGAGSATIAAPHLIGRTVVAWVDGEPVLDPTITDPTLDDALQLLVDGTGHVTLPHIPAVGGFLGLPYVARFKSGRLAYGVGQSSPVLSKMSLQSLGLMLADFCRSGVRFGTEFDNADHPLQSMPELDSTGAVADEVVLGSGPDEVPLALGGGISLDSRVCIEARSPKPVSVKALLMGISR